MKKLEKILKEYKKTTHFIYKYDWKGINYPPGKDDWEKLRKITKQLFLKCHVKKTQIMKKNIISTLPNEEG